MKVSIVTVCLNKKEDLEDCIHSVKNQTYQNKEHIIIDGDSADGSKEIFNKYKNNISKLVIEKDNGVYEAMNKGVKLASGDIIYFLNSDDRFYNDRVIEEAVKAFTICPEVDFIYGNLVTHDPITGKRHAETYPEKISRWLFIRKTIGHPATFFRSSCFKKVGYFDDRYKIAADYEWYLRALYSIRLRSFHIAKNISVFRLGGISTNQKFRDLYFSERRAIQKKYFNVFELACADILRFMRKKLYA